MTFKNETKFLINFTYEYMTSELTIHVSA